MKKETRLAVKILTNKKQNRIFKGEADSFRIELKAKPVEGQANRELVKFLAKLLDVHQSQILIIKGLHSRQKIVLIENVMEETVMEKMNLETQAP